MTPTNDIDIAVLEKIHRLHGSLWQLRQATMTAWSVQEDAGIKLADLKATNTKRIRECNEEIARLASKTRSEKRYLFEKTTTLDQRKQYCWDVAVIKERAAERRALYVVLAQLRQRYKTRQKKFNRVREVYKRAQWRYIAAVLENEPDILKELQDDPTVRIRMTEDKVVHVYFGIEGSISAFRKGEDETHGHLVILDDGSVPYLRRPAEPHGPWNVRVLAEQGVLNSSGCLGAPLLLNLFFDKPAALVLPKVGVNAFFAKQLRMRALFSNFAFV